MNGDLTLNSIFDVPFEAPFGASQGTSDGPHSSGATLFGLNNHGALMNPIGLQIRHDFLRSISLTLPLAGSAFEDAPRGREDTFARRSFSHGGAGMNDALDGRPSSVYRGQQRDRSASPRARTTQTSGTRSDHRGSFQLHSNRGGAYGPAADIDGRPDQIENQTDPGRYAYPLTGQNLQSFESMSEKVGLDTAGHAFALMQAELISDNNRHLGQAVMQGQIMMEVSHLRGQLAQMTDQLASVSNLHGQIANMTEQLATVAQIVEALASAPPQPPAQAPSSMESTVVATSVVDAPWEPSPQLLDVMNPLALSLMNSPQLFSYTALKNKREGILPHSLFNVMKLTIAKESAAFIARNLPPVHQGVEEASAAKRYHSAIKDCGKHAREKVHIVLLTGIHDPKMGEEVDEPVPHIKSMVQQVAQRCGTVGVKCHMDTVWAATDLLTRARIAYLRREAARIVLKGGKGSQSIWACVDKQLSKMRLRDDERYSIAFYQIIFDDDCKYFDGATFFNELKERGMNLDLPSDEAILARMAVAPAADPSALV
ncbi:uncharacterized protein MELLADRAFT_88123 [Melampsora larici-populina 98AG31]|uniref:Uncharacterized protein n=1 Tax=Melampsora larici-populina (strain 98AG31 / pathotype 3-4-7) TaxID=747676 RepID=F4SE44_MELLP|nr:uncharacterized protein MELLADRAFT_88123 [Melampsora larici-populina 98AG31]EGF97083.1 hypothetical protein MELLADRAFT_88123 [Melampsora larici-populina 98AG31]